MENDLQKFFSKFVDECKYSRRLRSETLRGYEAIFKLFCLIMPEVKSTQLLTREMLNEFFKRLQTRTRIVGKNTERVGLQDSTVKTYSNKLNAFFVWLMQEKIIKNNPLEHIKLRHPVYTDQRALSREEVQKILASVSLHSTNSLMLKRDTAMIHLLLFTGLRAGEFVSLRVIDVDMEKHLITVRAETSKSKKTRHIPMHPTLVLHLEEYFKERRKGNYKTEYLFVSSNEDKGLTRHGLKHWVGRLIKLSGVKFHLHRFRHSFACNLYKSGANLLKIQALMGHADIKMTMSYLRSIKYEDTREDILKLLV